MLLLLATATAAIGHPLLLESSPAAGAVLATPPRRLVLRFNNRIEKPLSRIRLVDGHGGAKALSLLAGEGGEERLVAELPPLAPGVYRVEWRALSTDGHVVNGAYSFRVGP